MRRVVLTRRASNIGRLGPLTPAILLEASIFFAPMLILGIISFTERASYFFEPVYTLDNYYKIFLHYTFDFQNTLMLVSAAAFLDLVLGYPFAYFMVRRIKRFADTFRSILLIPLFGELYIGYGLWYVFLPKGPLAFVFESLGIPVHKVLYAAPSAIFALAIYTLPFVVYNVGISLQQIEPSLEQAARCLGAGPVQTFLRVTLPLSVPGLLSGWLMSFGWNLGSYAIPVLLGGAITGQRVLSVKVYSIGLVMMDFGMAAAFGVLLLILALGVFYLSLKASKRGLV